MKEKNYVNEGGLARQISSKIRKALPKTLMLKTDLTGRAPTYLAWSLIAAAVAMGLPEKEFECFRGCIIRQFYARDLQEGDGPGAAKLI